MTTLSSLPLESLASLFLVLNACVGLLWAGITCAFALMALHG